MKRTLRQNEARISVVEVHRSSILLHTDSAAESLGNILISGILSSQITEYPHLRNIISEISSPNTEYSQLRNIFMMNHLINSVVSKISSSQSIDIGISSSQNIPEIGSAKVTHGGGPMPTCALPGQHSTTREHASGPATRLRTMLSRLLFLVLP